MKERPDQGITGNQGYIIGSPPVSAQAPGPKMRETYVIEVEIPSQAKPKEIPKVEPLEIEPSRESPEPAEETKLKPQTKAIITEQEVALPEKTAPQAVIIKEKEPPEELPATYVVKKGDTLEKIAARKDIYGDKNKWIKIYNANKDILTAPDRIYPGQVLKIPRD
jgi:nucleoid-associated protein YgaU